MLTIGDRLKIARDKKGVKQTRVSDDTGINNKTLSGYERNVSEPDLDTIKILAEYYNISLDFLLGKTDKITPYAETPEDNKDIDVVDEFLLDLKKKAKKRGIEFDENSVDDLLDLYEFIKKREDK